MDTEQRLVAAKYKGQGKSDYIGVARENVLNCATGAKINNCSSKHQMV